MKTIVRIKIGLIGGGLVLSLAAASPFIYNGARRARDFDTAVAVAQMALKNKREWRKQKILDVNRELVACVARSPFEDCHHQAEQDRQAINSSYVTAEAAVQEKRQAKLVVVISSALTAFFVAVVGFALPTFVYAAYRIKKVMHPREPAAS